MDHKTFALLIHGLEPEGLSSDPRLLTVCSAENAYYPLLAGETGQDDVTLFLGYNWYPPRLANTVEQAGGEANPVFHACS